MGPIRIILTIIQVVIKLFQIVPKLNEKTKHIRDRSARSKTQESLVHKALMEIPGYRHYEEKMKPGHRVPVVTSLNPVELGAKATLQSARFAIANVQEPYDLSPREPQRSYHAVVNPELREKALEEAFQAKPKPKHQTGYEDYPFLHDLLK